MMRRIFIFLLVVLTSYSAFAKKTDPFASKTTYIPNRFRAYISTEGSPSYEVKMIKGILYYVVYDRQHKSPKVNKVNPTSQDWKMFRQDIDTIKIWQWIDIYKGTSSQGTKWSVDIAYADKTVQADGVNSYPDEEGKAQAANVPNKIFDRYLAAVGNLIQKQFR